MGFLDKVKGTAKQAINPIGQAGERDKITRINKSGVEVDPDDPQSLLVWGVAS